MRIGLQTWGSEGDIRPFLALAGALSKAGHDVTLVITELDDRTYGRYAEALGIELRMVAQPMPERLAELESFGAELIRVSTLNQARLINERLFEPVVPEMFDAARQLCAEVDVVVGHFFHYPVRCAAELAGVPQVSVTFSTDMVPSGAYPPTGVPALGRWWNRAWWGIANWMINREFLPPVNAFRADVGLPRLKSMQDAWHSRRLDLLAVSPTLCPPRPDWGERYRVTGFLGVPPSNELEELPAEVEAFLRAGESPILIGFGSLRPKSEQRRAEMRTLLGEAVARAGGRAIIQNMAEPGESTPGILDVGRVSHASLFPRCAAIVHHGGAGTTQTAVRSGVPSIVVPHVADQFAWGAILHRRGMAPKPLPRMKLTAAALADRIRAARDPSMREQAKQVGAAVAKEDGPREAVRLIETLFSSR